MEKGYIGFLSFVADLQVVEQKFYPISTTELIQNVINFLVLVSFLQGAMDDLP